MTDAEREALRERMARICCCEGPILDKRRPAETMVCCGRYLLVPETPAIRAPGAA